MASVHRRIYAWTGTYIVLLYDPHLFLKHNDIMNCSNFFRWNRINLEKPEGSIVQPCNGIDLLITYISKLNTVCVLTLNFRGDVRLAGTQCALVVLAAPFQRLRLRFPILWLNLRTKWRRHRPMGYYALEMLAVPLVFSQEFHSSICGQRAFSAAKFCLSDEATSCDQKRTSVQESAVVEHLLVLRCRRGSPGQRPSLLWTLSYPLCDDATEDQRKTSAEGSAASWKSYHQYSRWHQSSVSLGLLQSKVSSPLDHEPTAPREASLLARSPKEIWQKTASWRESPQQA